MQPIIQVNNLVKTYKGQKTNAVDNISFDVQKGEFFTLLGPNGAGKTTTISILTTTLNKTSGSINITDLDLDKGASEIRKNIGVIFQNPSLDLNLTAEENIRFHTFMYQMYGFSPAFTLMPKEYKNKVYELAELLDIKNELFKPLKSFSGGMKRKLEIIRSLMHDPHILFLDEPTSGLDPLSRKNLWDYLKEVRRTKNTTMFLTTHYLEEAENSDKVCIINHGKIVKFDTPQNIKKDILRDHLIINALDKQSLRKELEHLNLKFKEDEEFKIDLTAVTVQEIIKKINTELTEVRTHLPSLEEAYLEYIGISNSADQFAKVETTTEKKDA